MNKFQLEYQQRSLEHCSIFIDNVKIVEGLVIQRITSITAGVSYVEWVFGRKHFSWLTPVPTILHGISLLCNVMAVNIHSLSKADRHAATPSDDLCFIQCLRLKHLALALMCDKFCSQWRSDLSSIKY